jgi:hypothetical protein
MLPSCALVEDSSTAPGNAPVIATVTFSLTRAVGKWGPLDQIAKRLMFGASRRSRPAITGRLPQRCLHPAGPGQNGPIFAAAPNDLNPQR